MLCCARILGIVEVNIGLQMQQDREAANAIEQVNAFVPVRPQRKLKDQRGDHEQDRHALHEHAHARMGEALASEWSGNAAEMASRPLVRAFVLMLGGNKQRARATPSEHTLEGVLADDGNAVFAIVAFSDAAGATLQARCATLHYAATCNMGRCRMSGARGGTV